MEVRGAIARAATARVTAKSDRFTIPVAAIRKAAVGGFELDQRKMTRVDFNTAKPDLIIPLQYWRGTPEKLCWSEVVGSPSYPQRR